MDECEPRPLRRRSVGPIFRALFRKSLLTFTPLGMTLTGESALFGDVGGRVLGPLSDLLEDLLDPLFLTVSLRVRLFLLSDRVRFLIELLLLNDGDLDVVPDFNVVASAGDSVRFLATETLFFMSGDHVEEVALDDDGLNLEYFVGSSMRSDWTSLSTISGFLNGRSIVFETVFAISSRLVLLGAVDTGFGEVALCTTSTWTIITSSSSTFKTRSMSSARCLISSRV